MAIANQASRYIAENTFKMRKPEREKQTHEIAAASLMLNKAMLREQYRLMVLKPHNQKMIKLINPHDPLCFYLN